MIAVDQITEASARLAAIVESSQDAIISKSLEGVVLSWNPAAEKMFGYAPAEVVGKSILLLFPPGRQSEETRLLARIARGEKIEPFDTVRLRKNGRPVDVSVSLSPLRDARGRIVGAATIARDISASSQVEAALRQSEERLTTVIEHLAEGLVISKLDGQILHWNRAALEMHEFRSVEEGRRALPEFQKIFELASLDGRMLPLDEWPISRIFRGEVLKDVEVRIRKVTNNWQRILSYGGMLITDRTGERLAIVTILDITDRKRAEEAIRESSEFNRQIMMGAREGLVVLDRELRYQVFNPAMEEITGWRADNIVGRCLHELFPPEQIADGIARVRRALAGETLPTMDVFMPHANRPHPIWVSSTLSPLRNVRGEIIGVIGVVNDITERKRAEDALREAHASLEDRVRERTAELAVVTKRAQAADKLKSEFLANMSHELRTPLNGIIGFSEFLFDEKPGPLNPKQKEYIGDVLNSGRHLLELINDVLDLSKIEAGRMTLRPVRCSLHRAIEEVCAVVSPLAQKKGLALQRRLALEDDVASLDVGRIKQVLYNLLSNAVKFTDAGSVDIVAAPAAQPGWIRIDVRDTGIGIAAGDIAKLFVEFQQLDASRTRRHEGTGLGLALTKKIVELHGGRVAVASEPGQGSTFTVELPRGAATSPEKS